MKTIVTLSSLAACLLLVSVQIPSQGADDPSAPDPALQHYLDNGDDSFAWEIRESYRIGNIRVADLVLTSQTWREHTWKHQLTVFAPDEIDDDGALLWVTGGSVKQGMPNFKAKNDGEALAFAYLAAERKTMAAVLRQVPNQPLYDDLTEDELISYTLHQFKKDGDFTWPLLFPMVKSAVRAMDAVQEVARQEWDHTVGRFVVSGGSKRGWTTWLTGSQDDRVSAIAPMVIDVLNMPVNLDYQVEVWDQYSVQINDYVQLGIAQAASTPDGEQLNRLIDPYYYRTNLAMPKMIFIGTNDEYWPVDAIKHYYDDIPGENYIHYVPNAGHGLGDRKQALGALGAFVDYSFSAQPYPKCTWQLKEKSTMATLKVTGSGQLLDGALLWSSSSEDRDFRDAEWSSEPLKVSGKSLTAKINYPSSGFTAFYVDLIYPSPAGKKYSQSTRVFVADTDEVL